ncbi:MAG: hypothetical protein HPZ91_04580 [Lentisphaeria bacterium]|nr:hypothetical protein [Lentisphaeria bacterium]
MKRWIFLLALLPAMLRGAGEFEKAEQLFTQGDPAACGKLIAELLAPDSRVRLAPEQKLRLQAMQEHLIGSSPEAISENVKAAKEVAVHPNWLTADLLNYSALFIRRATEWKKRGIPEYQELSDAAEKLLSRATDNGDPDTAIRILLLRVRNFNLNGEYNEPLMLISRMLSFYFPAGKRSAKNGTDALVQLWMLAGEQNMGIGARSSDEREKINVLTKGANFYLRAAEEMKTDDPRFEELCARLHYCREALKLLGCGLTLPARITAPPEMKTAIIDEMFRQRRFHDAVLALDGRQEPELRIRRAAALCAIGQIDQALAIVETPKFRIVAPAFLPRMARDCFAAGRKDEALRLLKLYLKTLPGGVDADAAATDCARLLLDAGRYSDAAVFFRKLAKTTKDPARRESATFSAAQCLFRAKQYKACIELAETLPVKPDHILLISRAQMVSGRAAAALTGLKTLLADPGLPAGLKPDVLKLAIDCSSADPKQQAAYCKQFTNEYAELSESFGYAVLLAGLHEKAKAPDREFRSLAVWTLKHHMMKKEAVPFILRCVSKIGNANTGQELCRKLLACDSFSPAELAVLLRELPSDALKAEFWKKYRIPFDSRPETCEVYYQAARMEKNRKNHSGALMLCRQLLGEKNVYRYPDVKLLEAEALDASGQGDEARRSCQELLLGKLTPVERQKITLMLAGSWERSGAPEKAIATAWSAVPPDGRGGPEVRALLKLILRNAEKIGSAPDREEAAELLELAGQK